MADTPTISDSLRDHLVLALIPGLGPKLTAALLEQFGSPQAARMATVIQLRGIPHIGEKTADAFAAALRAVDIEPELQLLAKHQVTPIPLGFPSYPQPIAGLVNPPPLLYFRGQWLEEDTTAIAIVGSRACTGYGKKMAEQIARDLARAGITVISGLARGIDASAHRGALEGGGRTIAVLAGGLSAIYPPEHADLAEEIVGRGALVSETPMTVAPQPGMFPARNRIISGLSRAVVVIEANLRSGALITARHALEQGREVFAVPGAVDSPASAGCLELVRNGARMVRSADDILDDLKGVANQEYGKTPAAKEKKEKRTPPPDLFPKVDPEPIAPPNLEGLHLKIWELLAERRHIDDLSREIGVPVGDLARGLMQLELKRLVRRLPGNTYERR